MDKCFALDTNILLDYFYDFMDKNRHLQAEKLVKSLKGRSSEIYIPNTVKTEVLEITAGSFAILRNSLILEMQKINWDNLSIEERDKALDRIRDNFDELFENTRKKLYPDTTPGIRLFLAKRLFSKLRNELINRRLSEIKDFVLTENRIKDSEEYLIRRISNEFSLFPSLISISSSSEELMKLNIFMRAFGKVKNIGLIDSTLFSEIFLALKGGVCESITLISNDYDLATIKESLLNNLNDFIKSSSNNDHRNYAEEMRDLIHSNLKVVKLEEILNKLASSPT
ncbi:hypothetical protein [Sulfolobus acidocaldarius]|uniref:DUF4935 domain-containing protein n=4 Tax=Sulfolobus acidocaldarius TaxID=2285 RepID=Q4JBC8_SULAC|nr:hypothetical protein [Sulfolobus acidocaldarius]AAY79901.1 hypothetical protein Saci_0495 [Sulfolobus acidocaldarius DSM 639]AGE70466.1 hypothetical protein SacN8_02430 [Sulfolobus acidocaldarius N8]AGE72740.1 hypothetical protein SacRon12I_02425 [Sulfolobus acidocaldarius Ron12/I]ALU29155.1 hypothetical protein ATY89_03850 [Sulfolobus acidocaldarius]ALU31880.1 hypothetical protein ATZ20_06875 [Sulfolobus acidocaldarius]